PRFGARTGSRAATAVRPAGRRCDRGSPGSRPALSTQPVCQSCGRCWAEIAQKLRGGRGTHARSTAPARVTRGEAAGPAAGTALELLRDGEDDAMATESISILFPASVRERVLEQHGVLRALLQHT